MSRKELHRSLQKEFKANAPEHLQPDQPSRVSFYYGYLNGPTTRAAVYLTNQGCPWKVDGPGCVMCSLSASFTPQQITPQDFMAQIRSVVQKVLAYESKHGTKVPELDLYNDGSVLNPQEIPSETLFQMLQEAQKLQLRRIVLESLPEFVTSERMRRVVESAHPAEITIAMGVETFSESFRTKVLTKPSPNALLERATKIIEEARATPKAYVLLKPPLMSEGEAVHDAINAIQYCQTIGIREVSLEPVVTGNAGTLQHRLSQLSKEHPCHWRPPWLWSILKVLLKTRDLAIDVYPSIFTTPHLDMSFVDRFVIPHNCVLCSHKITEVLVDYHRFRSIQGLEEAANSDCTCKVIWEEDLHRILPDPIEERGKILNTLSGAMLRNFQPSS